MIKPIRLSALMLALSAMAHAQIASDNAANYGGSWANGSNFGTGFGAWNLTGNNGGGNFAGNFIGSSIGNPPTDPGAGDINTSGVSFGLFANPGSAWVNANRVLSSPMTSLDVLTFKLALNYDNGYKGFNLFSNSTQVLYFTVHNGATVGSSATLVAGPGAGYNYGGSDAVIDVTIAMTTGTSFSYAISRTSSSGFQGNLFTGNVSGLTTGIEAFNFYVNGTDNGASANNLYFNSLSVVPEPSTFALLGLGLASFAIRRKTKIS